MTDPHHTQAVNHDDAGDPQLRMFERQLRRYSGDGDCAYERALITLYQKLFDQRRQQLEALRIAGL